MTRVVRVLAPNPGPFTLEGTNTWVLGDGPSLVIDPGPDDPGHLEVVWREAAALAAIVLTHHHPDHAPGAARLASLTGAPVHAYRPAEGEQPLPPGTELRAGDVRIRAIHTPGHTEDHIALFLEDERWLFTGDAVLGRGTSIVNPPEGDMAAYVRSLKVMLELEPRTIYPGHGPVVLTPRGRLEYYLRHRAEREDQVLAALASGKHTPDEMVPGIYGHDVPEEMHAAASRSVLAHLLKLQREGRVARTGRSSDHRFVLVEPRPCARCGRQAVPGSRFCRRCGLSALQEGPPSGRAGSSG